MSFDDELARMKRDIDLRAYAEQHGFRRDAKESSRHSAVMRNAISDEKVVITRAPDGNWIFCSTRDESDRGSIIDFAQRRLKISLGALRKELRPWINESSQRPLPSPPLASASPDRQRVDHAYRMTEAVTTHSYLECERCIPAHVLASERFAGCIRRDGRNNAVFPHHAEGRMCGFELKNKNFTGFSPGGVKGLWMSQEQERDERLVICESAIDVLSYAALFPEERTRYASIGGQLNPRQPELIGAAIARMPEGSEIVAAMDADAAGRKLADCVRASVAKTGRPDLRFVMVEPFGWKDWNCQLQGRREAPRTAAHETPAPQ